jgi:hypothetical protein
MKAEAERLTARCDKLDRENARMLDFSCVETLARAERAEAAETVAFAQWNGALERAMKAEAERDQLRAALALGQENCDAVYDELRADCDELRGDVVRLTARAERVEADLAVERARLDAGTILLNVAGERVWHCGVDLRAAIDAGVKEGAK